MFEKLCNKVRDSVQKHEMLPKNEKVVAAVSGGPDSMCLLHVLLALDQPVEVAHFDHQTREGESTKDALFVQELCHKLGIPCHIETANVAEEKKRTGLSFEESARELRYDFLFRVSRKIGAKIIATGHHADDLVETLLMRLLRGTSPHGIIGIPPVTLRNEIRIIRPLIECRNAEILAALKEKSIPYRLDYTNQQLLYTRNRIRNELLPLLREKYNPEVDAALIRYAELCRTENDFISELAAKAFGDTVDEKGYLDRRKFLVLHPALQRRIILLWTRKSAASPPFEIVERIREALQLGDSGQQWDVGEKITMVLSRYKAHLREHGKENSDRANGENTVLLPIPGEALIQGKRFCARTLPDLPDIPPADYCTSTRQIFDADRVQSPLEIRPRKPGDAFVPHGMQGHKKLKKYLSEKDVPRHKRQHQLVVASGGEIIWVVGHACSATCSVTTQTQRVLEIEVIEENPAADEAS